ncbi:MAG: FAD-dependent oxidoreductase [Sandaracinaceae bacterium]|nr:FAD-dependent oxidoreductase [Sandaracinaceae bacterium]
MARTLLFDWFRRLYAMHRLARERAMPPLEVVGMDLEERRLKWSRRGVLRAGMIGAGAMAMRGLSACDAPGESIPVAVVGAGLAGLVCTHRLHQAGLRVQLFEASNRTGGRTFTARGMLEGGQICELGGELVNSNHMTMHALVMEFGLSLDDLLEPSLRETYHIGGRDVPVDEISTAFEPVAQAIARDFEPTMEVDAMGEPTPRAIEAFMRLDRTSLKDWLGDPRNGANPLIRTLLEIAYICEYGLEAEEQSVLNLMYLIDYRMVRPFRILGDSDERYHIHEGSEAIAQAITRLYADRIHLEHRLVAIRKGSGGKIRLVFSRGGSTVERDFEQVVFTIPFTMLREVEIDDGLISPMKRMTINGLGYGTNAKLMMQTRTRVWRGMGKNGAGYTDNGAQAFWDTSRGQAGAHGILTNFTGGRKGVEIGQGSASEQADRTAQLIEQVFPGFVGARNGTALRMHWPTAPFAKGSYACYRPGQWSWHGLERETEAEGKLLFAGEHTSVDFQGFMEGAASEGARAAMEILERRRMRGRAEMLVELGLVVPSRPHPRRGLLRVAEAIRRNHSQ